VERIQLESTKGRRSFSKLFCLLTNHVVCHSVQAKTSWILMNSVDWLVKDQKPAQSLQLQKNFTMTFVTFKVILPTDR